MDIPRQVRVVLASVFVGSLAAILIAGLVWAYTPERGGGFRFRPDTVPLEGDANGAAAGATPAPETTTEEAGADEGDEPPSPSPSPTPTEDREELIAAAPDPVETSVQVLDAGGGSAATSDAAALLGELGYRVANVTSSRTEHERTTVWYTDGNEPQARALRAREGRFGEIGPNERLNEGTHLHVLVGEDWD